jgi:glycosyltransferase involved in cell wall biosynthesis
MVRSGPVLQDITPLILTYNEGPNIGRTLDQLIWAREVVVVDSFSTDDTLDLVRQRPNTRIVQRRFDNFAAQWTFGLTDAAIRTPWVLALDADYVLGPGMLAELTGLRPDAGVSGYRVRFRYCIDGHPLRGTLYPAATVLFRRDAAHFEQDGHAYRLIVDAGTIETLSSRIFHDDRKSLARWLTSQARYAEEEVDKLRSTSWSKLSWPDRVRKVPFLAAPLVAAHCLISKGCALDGRAGYTYAGQRAIAELIISLKLLDRRP